MTVKNTLLSNFIKWHEIDALILDCDGVLTDGTIQIDELGNHYRSFDIRDGLGLVRLREAGVQIGIVSSATYQSVVYRAKSLGIMDVFTGVSNKTIEIQRLSTQWGIPLERIAYIGDDLVDLPAMRLVGIPVALADAISEVLEEAAFVATKGGGKGGVREICDLILSAKPI